MLFHRYLIPISGLLIALVNHSLSSAPMLSVENTTYNCGILFEGKSEIATAVFDIQNSGDSPLKISNVRPGCGCVVAAFDTLIPPGKTGHIKLEARLKGYSGDVRKSATVISNAQNQPTILLTLSATIHPIIKVSKQYISFQSSNGQTFESLSLSSFKKDLTITSIQFKPYYNHNSTNWENKLLIPVTYEWNKTDSITQDHSIVYILSIKKPENTESVTGEFILSTNHPDKREIHINGGI